MFRHPALPGLHAGNAAARRSLKSSGKKATRGHINKAGPSRPPGAARRGRHPRCRSATSCPLPSARARDTRPAGRINGRAVSVQAPEVPAPPRASADPRLPAGERRAPAAREVPVERGARRGSRSAPTGGASRRPDAGAALSLVAVAARRLGLPGRAGAAASVAAASEDLVGSGRDRASRPAPKLSLTSPRGARGAATRVRRARARG